VYIVYAQYIIAAWMKSMDGKRNVEKFFSKRHEFKIARRSPEVVSHTKKKKSIAASALLFFGSKGLILAAPCLDWQEEGYGGMAGIALFGR